MEIQKLCPGGKLPDDLKERMRKMEWTDFMQEVFDCLHKNEVSHWYNLIQLKGNITFTNQVSKLWYILTIAGYARSNKKMHTESSIYDRGYTNDGYTKKPILRDNHNFGCQFSLYIRAARCCKSHIIYYKSFYQPCVLWRCKKYSRLTIITKLNIYT